MCVCVRRALLALLAFPCLETEAWGWMGVGGGAGERQVKEGERCGGWGWLGAGRKERGVGEGEGEGGCVYCLPDALQGISPFTTPVFPC